MTVDEFRKWVEALRSKKYKQGFNSLKNNDCYCCLGVLCEINGEGIFQDDYGNELSYPDSKYHPKTVSMLGGNNLIVSGIYVSMFNDGTSSELLKSKPLTFLEIADLIEKEFITNVKEY